jgi:hypothetical protein
VFLGFLVFFHTAFALTPEQVLKTAWSDKTYLVHENIQDTDSKNPFRNVEATYTNEQNGSTETEIELKFNLKSFAEWKSGRSRTDQAKVLKESALAWALRDRYSLILSYSLGEQKLKAITTSIETSEKNMKAIGLSMQAARSTSKNYLDAKEDLLRLNRAKALLLEEREILNKRLQRWLPEGDPKIEGLDILNVDDVAAALQAKASPAESLTGKLAQEEIQQIDQELQIVKGRENQWFKSFDISQAEKKHEKFYELGLTLQLPPLGSDDLSKQRQNELILKKALKQRDYENTSDRLQILRFQILNAIELYKSASGNLTAISKTRSTDPLVNLQTKLSSQKEQLDLLTQQQGILTLYLDYLVESEVLSKEPSVNHLSQAKKAIP